MEQIMLSDLEKKNVMGEIEQKGLAADLAFLHVKLWFIVA